MPTAGGGFEQAYNAQAGVDTDTHVIVEQHVTDHPNDKQEIAPALARLDARYAKRKSTVETVFGIIKHVLGFRQFLLRGLKAVQGEWALVCLGWNLKRLFALKA
jgi:hypothetical protein